MRKIIFVLLLTGLLLLCNRGFSVKAERSDTVVNVIYNNRQIKKDQELTLRFTLLAFYDLYQADIVIKYDNSKLKPVETNGQCFVFSENRIFGQAGSGDIMAINNVVDEKYCRLTYFKGKQIDTGYTCGLFSHLGTVSFTALTEIEDVEDVISLDFFDASALGLRFGFYRPFASGGETIPFWVNVVEEIKITWPKETYKMEVFDDLPNFLSDVQVLNRDSGEFHLQVLAQDINPNHIGIQIIKLQVTDFLTEEVCFLAKPLEVIDSKPPEIIVPASITVFDNQLSWENLMVAQVIDNYDSQVNPIPKYFQEDGTQIDTWENFLLFLAHNPTGKIVFGAYDSSGNKAIDKETVITVIDKSPPFVNCAEELYLEDWALADFDFYTWVEVKDAYDPSPNLALIGINQLGIQLEDYKAILQEEKSVIVRFFAFDKEMNQTPSYDVRIVLVDTTAPSLHCEPVWELVDPALETFDFRDGFVVTDAFDQNPQIKLQYFLDENYSEEVGKEEFIKGLKNNLCGYLLCRATDYSGNQSAPVQQKIIIKDTVAPKIFVDGVEDQKKYLLIKKINYSVTDNLDDFPVVEIYLNGEEYDGSALTEIKDYQLLVIATDQSGNESRVRINFSVIEDTLIGCGGDVECYLDNYRLVVGIAGGILGLVALIVLGRFWFQYRRRLKAPI